MLCYVMYAMLCCDVLCALPCGRMLIMPIRHAMLRDAAALNSSINTHCVLYIHSPVPPQEVRESNFEKNPPEHPPCSSLFHPTRRKVHKLLHFAVQEKIA
jgi:hypothetical protein